jgi:hypothetical protein
VLGRPRLHGGAKRAQRVHVLMELAGRALGHLADRDPLLRARALILSSTSVMLRT